MAEDPVKPQPAAPEAAVAGPAATQEGAGAAATKSTEKKPKSDKQSKQDKAAEGAPANGDSKVSGAELKKRAKEEKAARRAKEKADKEAAMGRPGALSQGAQQTSKKAQDGQKGQGQASGQGQGQGQGQVGGAQQKSRTMSQSNGQQLPLRPRQQGHGAAASKDSRRANKEVGLFGHLYSQPKKGSMEGVSKEVHPAVLALGFQMSSYTICGSNARCIAMLLAFKKAIQSYTTPFGNSLARHMTSHYLSPQIDYLKSHRPISVSMGNAIRWLKDYIIHIDPDTPEALAKANIAEAIDIFIRERITVADTAIADTAATKIRDGMTVATFAKSSIVEKTLLSARAQGKRFNVVVVDSRPLFEGKNLVRSLSKAGIETSYMLHTAASHALRNADLVLLGAHAMMANGRLYSRCGTAALAMLAHGRDIPVIVCCESVKFTDRVALDSIVLNEIAPPDELILPFEPESVSAPKEAKAETGGKKAGAKKGEEEEESKEDGTLRKWRDVQNLQLLNILYDVTPAEYINMVITEYGSLPPSSVPAVHRISTERDVRA